MILSIQHVRRYLTGTVWVVVVLEQPAAQRAVDRSIDLLQGPHGGRVILLDSREVIIRGGINIDGLFWRCRSSGSQFIYKATRWKVYWCKDAVLLFSAPSLHYLESESAASAVKGSAIFFNAGLICLQLLSCQGLSWSLRFAASTGRLIPH